MPLKVSDGIGAWIKDFKKSDAPQFKGKSEKERRDQAIAAYLSAKRGDQNENIKSADKKPEVYTKPDGKRGVRMVATDKDVVKTEAKQTHVFDNEKDARAKAKEIGGKYVKGTGKSAGKHAAIKEAAPKPLNRSDHTHTVHIDGEGKFRVKAKSMDHAKKVAFKQAGISKLHGHPTMEPKTRIYGESVNKTAGMKLDEMREPYAVIDTADGNKVVGTASDEKGAKSIISTSQLPPMKIKDKKTLKIVKVKKKQMIGHPIKEETNFQVNIEGLPMMFMSGMGQGEIMQKLRKIVKQPSMIQSVKRVTDADVKKTFRLKAQGRDEEEQVDEAKLDELSPALLKRYDDASAKKHAMPGGGSTYKDTRTARNRAVGSIRSLKRQAGLKGKTDKVSRADHMKAVNQKNEAKLDELSPATMARYHSAADKSKARGWAKSDLGKSTPAAALKNQEKRTAGQKLARKKINQKAFRTSK